MSCETTDDVVVRRELHVDSSPERLWRAIVEPGAMADWLAAEADIELAVGGTGRFVDDDGRERLAVVESIVAERQLSFRWWPADGGDASRVTLTVHDDDDGGARLLVLEEPVPRPGVHLRAQAASARAAGWEARLDRLALALAGAALVGSPW